MTFVLAHLSDPHIGPLPPVPFRKLLNKRLTGTLNWHSSRATIHNMDVLEAIFDDILAHNPDHIALTGDLVNVGYAPEFQQALARTQRLGDGHKVSIVPGNHDAYTGESLPEMLKVFRPFMRDDASEGEATFPYLRKRSNIAFIGVNTGIPTLPFFATGALGAFQRARLAAMLDEARQEGLFRVVMIHHPPLRRAARFGRGLNDAEAVTELLAEHGAELVLHGHNHRHSLHLVEESQGAEGRNAGKEKPGTIPVLGVASASAVPGTPRHRAEYHLIRIDTKTGAMDITRRGFREHGLEIENIDLLTFPPKVPLRPAGA